MSDEQTEEIVQTVTAEQLINQQQTQLKGREVSRIYLETINVLMTQNGLTNCIGNLIKMSKSDSQDLSLRA